MEDKNKQVENSAVQLGRIGDLLDKHFNPPKKVNRMQILMYLLAGAAAIWALNKFYEIIQAMFYFNIPV